MTINIEKYATIDNLGWQIYDSCDFLAKMSILLEGDILKNGHSIVSDDKEVCELFNEYFSSVASNIGFSDDIPDDYNTDHGFQCILKKYENHPSICKIQNNVNTEDKFDFCPVTISQVQKIIENMDPKKAQGCDNIPTKLLRIGSHPLAQTLTGHINCAFEKATYPDSLKLAEVSSQFKKNDNLDKMNYRPVSILTAISKVYERAMSSQLIVYFDKIFSSLLSAFRKRHSCESALLNMVEDFKYALDKGKYVACVSMDLSKAFDCLPHCLTICKLKAYGLSTNSFKLIASYLYKRKQRVKINAVRSDWEDLNKGIPQGSILGPLIFNIFLNDIFYFVNTGSIYNYADDNYVSVQHEELGLVEKVLKQETLQLVKWFSDNALEANPNKFQGILFNRGHNVSSMQLQVNDNDISFVSSIHALGICIDDKLNFNDHVDRICSKAACQVSALQRLTSVLDFPSRKAIYNSFISSHFNYCPTVWFFTTRASIQKVEHIQERALRFVLRDSSSEYNTLLYKANVDSFRLNSLKKMVIEIFKIVNEFAPSYLSTIFEMSQSPYDMRDKSRLVQPKVNSTSYGLESFKYYGSHIWNLLPMHIKSAMSLPEFKELLTTWSGPTCKCSLCTVLL